jgi:NADH-quinone oxidoreductase subunit A
MRLRSLRGHAQQSSTCAYYLSPILFIVFDLEIAFLFPWAVALSKIECSVIGRHGIFLGILVVGFVFEWKKGALEWD